MANENEPMTDAARVVDTASILRMVQDMLTSVHPKDERSEAILQSVKLLVKNSTVILEEGFLP